MHDFVLCVFSALQSVLGKMNEIAKHKAAIEDAETQNKVGNHRMSVLAYSGIKDSPQHNFIFFT